MLLCVGDFFGDNNDELIAFKNGNKVIPVPTYILGPNEVNACPEYENLNEGEICSNLTYLGKSNFSCAIDIFVWSETSRSILMFYR